MSSCVLWKQRGSIIFIGGGKVYQRCMMNECDETQFFS